MIQVNDQSGEGFSISEDFAKLLATLSAEYDIEFSDPKIQLWHDGLKRFDIETLKTAVYGYIRSKRVPPRLADIIGNCETLCGGSGWLGSDEAWAKCPKTVHESALMTNETAQALAAANEQLMAGERIAARMTFKEAYERLIARSKLEGRAPVFFLSRGRDISGQEQALLEGVQRAQISLNTAIELLPERAERLIRQSGITSHPLLAQPTGQQRAQLKQVLLTLKIKSVADRTAEEK